MMPLVGVPETIAKQFGRYRDIFCREAGFEHVQRYMTGLLLSWSQTGPRLCCPPHGTVSDSSDCYDRQSAVD
ncbi:MAG: hypothetical protein ACKO24_10975 [Leptolyngbyaceae cyanobacterium]